MPACNAPTQIRNPNQQKVRKHEVFIIIHPNPIAHSNFKWYRDGGNFSASRKQTIKRAVLPFTNEFQKQAQNKFYFEVDFRRLNTETFIVVSSFANVFAAGSCPHTLCMSSSTTA